MSGNISRVKPATLEYIEDVGCVNDCSKQIKINEGLQLECKEFTNIESAMLRRRALEDNQLFASGLVRRIERSSLGQDLRIKKRGIDVGPIRTRDSGARHFTECRYNFEGIKIDNFEKHFYIVNNNKHLKICLNKFIGTWVQDLIGDSMMDYDPMRFANTDFGMILLAAIIERYNRFAPEFMLLATQGGDGEGEHGDDGIFAKAHFASKGQYFHALEFDLSELGASGKVANLLVGGAKKSFAFDDFSGNLDLALIAITDWLNARKYKRWEMFNVSLDENTNKIVVTSTFATVRVELRIVINDGEMVDWGPHCTRAQEVQPRCLQENMLINDTPLLFEYEEINETNFIELFKKYIKEFTRYLHRNGFRDVNINDVRIGIDPELMLEYKDSVDTKFLRGMLPIDFAEQMGIRRNLFIELNALSGTGLFFMTVNSNLLMLSDGDNAAGMQANLGRIMIKELCEGEVGVIMDVPLGSAVEHWGLFASNQCGSWFEQENDLENQTPLQTTMKVLPCYDGNTRNRCITGQANCMVYAKIESEASYDSGSDTTTITVNINAGASDDSLTLIYDSRYSLSDGTAQSGISAPSYQITLPGDQTDSGLRINVEATVTAQDGGEDKCNCYTTHTNSFGEGVGSVLCSYQGDGTGRTLSAGLSLEYTTSAGVQSVAFVDSLLDLSNAADWPAIEVEIEAILPGTETSITDNGGAPVVEILDVPSFITAITINTNDEELPLDRDC